MWCAYYPCKDVPVWTAISHLCWCVMTTSVLTVHTHTHKHTNTHTHTIYSTHRCVYCKFAFYYPCKDVPVWTAISHLCWCVMTTSVLTVHTHTHTHTNAPMHTHQCTHTRTHTPYDRDYTPYCLIYNWPHPIHNMYDISVQSS